MYFYLDDLLYLNITRWQHNITTFINILLSESDNLPTPTLTNLTQYKNNHKRKFQPLLKMSFFQHLKHPYFALFILIILEFAFANLIPHRNSENGIGSMKRRPFSVNKTLEMLLQRKSKRDGISKPIFNEGR